MARTGASVVVYLGLGANLGDRAAALRDVLPALRDQGITPLRLSPVYESDYLGPGGPQPRYLNAVLAARTSLSPLAVLRRTQAIEGRFGRTPGTHMRPRPLDIDLLLYSDWWLRHADLVVPHPRLASRRFVLEPLRDLGALVHRPEYAQALATLPSAPALRPYALAAPGGWA